MDFVFFLLGIAGVTIALSYIKLSSPNELPNNAHGEQHADTHAAHH